MGTLRSRLTALEKTMTTSDCPKRVYMVSGDGTGAQIVDLIHSEGWEFDPTIDQAIHLAALAPLPGAPHLAEYRHSNLVMPLALAPPSNPEWRREAA